MPNQPVRNPQKVVDAIMNALKQPCASDLRVGQLISNTLTRWSQRRPMSLFYIEDEELAAAIEYCADWLSGEKREQQALDFKTVVAMAKGDLNLDYDGKSEAQFREKVAMAYELKVGGVPNLAKLIRGRDS